ncbi:MAG: hypothetical protein ACR2QH_12610 [Geminicoccaceae bacterium]
MASFDSSKIDFEIVDALINDLKAELSSSGVELEGPASVAGYIGYFDAVKQPSSYDHVPPEARHLIEIIEATGGPDISETYHRLVLLTLVQQLEKRAATLGVPKKQHDRTLGFLKKLVRRLQKPKPGQYRIDRDEFLKDLAVARLKLWPCGAELVDIASGIPRRMLLRAGAGQFIKTLGQVKFHCGGFKPFFETHFDQRMTREFSAEGYRSLYLTIAEMLQHAPAIRGMFSGSWWHDPALADISPNLAFLNSIAVAGGARLFPLGTDDQIIARATRLSKERTRLVREDVYQPTSYLMVWARKDLLRWAEAQTTVWTARSKLPTSASPNPFPSS